ncbi:MAG: flagellar hook-associated protein FlgL [Pseudomonadota bacterium]
MRISTIQQFNVALDRILDLQANTAEFQTQIATGRRINQPADDPVAAAQSLRIDQRVANVEQYNRNSDFASLRLNQQESSIASVNDALQRVRELVIRGKTTTLSQADRNFIAQEVRQRAEEIFDLSNSRNSSGEFIFAGSKVSTQAFSKNASGQVIYNGDQTTRDVQISEFRKVSEGLHGFDLFVAIRNGNGDFVTSPGAANNGTGRAIPVGVTDPNIFEKHDYRVVFTAPNTFDVIDDTAGAAVLTGQVYTEDAAINFAGIEISVSGVPQVGDEFHIDASRYQSVFDTLDTLNNALETTQVTAADEVNFQANMDRLLGELDNSMNNLREAQAIIGARQNTIQSQQNANSELSLQLQAAKSTLEDVDIVEAVGNLARTTNALEAAQTAFVRVQSLSLFNFLR